MAGKGQRFFLKTPLAQKPIMNNMLSAQSIYTFTGSLQSFFVGAFLPFLIIIAALIFFWGVITYVTAHEDDQRDEGKKIMSGGIIGIIVVIGLWALATFLLSADLMPKGPIRK